MTDEEAGLSQSSSPGSDPLSNVFEALGARVTRRTRLEAAGQWALAFPTMDRLKFVAVLRGAYWLLLPLHEPQLMQAGDVCVLGRTPYVVASDPEQSPVDGQFSYGADGCDVARLGGDDTIGIGGTVTFAAENADFLLNILPDFLFVSRASPSSGAIAKVLALMSEEIEHDRIGGAIVSSRLADVLLIEAIRAYSSQPETAEIGWHGALSDPRLGRALRAIPEDVAQSWTIARLARIAGMSRAAFAATFTRRLGQPPLSYLRAWRLTLARAALTSSNTTVAAISSKVGYTSQSAFSQAFKREFGSSPRAGHAP